MNHEMSEDTLIIPFNDQEELVIASDNIGAIGMKSLDEVTTPYHVVSYFGFRVAYMDCVAAGGKPFAISLMNFNGDEVWEELLHGIDKGVNELQINDLPITGSTETNFPLQQSATSITILGKRKRKQKQTQKIMLDNCHVAVIGQPLVGNEVIDNKEKVAPLHVFQWFSEQEEVYKILPVGSKGISYELNKVWHHHDITFSDDLDVTKSSGPATCFIVIYEKSMYEKMVNKASDWLHLSVNEE